MTESRPKIVITSGYFDPLHIGHMRLIEKCSSLGDILIVIVNTDRQAINKKGYVFYPLKDRIQLIKPLLEKWDIVVPSRDSDGSVCKTIKYIYNGYIKNRKVDVIFAKGGDRTAKNIPELKLCNQLGIECVFGVGGKKIRSSSESVKNAYHK